MMWILVETVVQFLPEHDGADIVQIDDTHQTVLTVHHREHIAARSRDGFYQFAQIHVRIQVFVVFLDDRVEAHQREYGTVFMVCEQLASFGQTHGIDAVGLERNNGQVGTDGYDHQGHE